jgi:uncharacterized phage-associated protein
MDRTSGALSAHDVAAVLRARLPGISVKKLHKLLYYCQGHHLAVFGEPLFTEAVSAWDMGPVVGELWHAEKHGRAPALHHAVPQAGLNTIGYVLSRYGALTGEDLEHLTHSEAPWLHADRERSAHGSVRIEQEWMRAYFQSAGAPDVTAGADPTRAAWLSEAGDRLDQPLRPDQPEEIRDRLGRVA